MTLSKKGRTTSIDVVAAHDNTSQETIWITTDRTKLILIDTLARIENSKSWTVPLGFLVTIVLVFCSAEFKDFWFTAATWRAVFLIGGVVSMCWLLLCLYRLKVSPTIDEVISEMKNNSNRAPL